MSLRKAISDSLPSTELNQSHSTAKEMRDYCYACDGRWFWNTAFKFSFVRNPFDWVVSLYEFIRGNSNHVNYEEIKDMDFETFCQWNVDCIKNKKKNPNGTFNTMTEFLYDENKVLLVDFIGRLENVDEDFKVIAKRLNIPLTNIHEVYVPKINPSNREPDYKSYYNDNSRKIIEEGFAEDLLNFNYSF